MPLSRPSPAGPARTEGRRSVALAGGALALALSLPFLGAGLASDDGAIVGWVARQPPLVDLVGPQFDVTSMRFWRPLMTLSFDVQEALGGATAWPLRLFNALAHAVAATMAGLLARRLGAGTLGIALAALWVATFPHQGGTTGWPSGRSDGLSLPLILTALWAAAGGRAGWAACAGALAVMTKEMAWLEAPLAFALLWARGDGVRGALRGSAPLVAVVALALAVRPLLIGALVGGYSAPPPDPWDVALGAPPAWSAALGPAVWAVAAVALAAVAARSGVAVRAIAGGVLVSWLGTAMLAQLVVDGAIAPEHVRAIHTPDAALGIALALATGWLVRTAPPRRRAAAALAVVALCAAVAWRGVHARADLARWAAAGDQAEREVAAARAVAERLGPSDAPLLDARFSRLDPSGRAYVMHWGVADRFRAPFAVAPRAVWPWRPAFAVADAEREWLGASDQPGAFGAAARARAGVIDAAWHGDAVRLEPGAELAAVRLDPADYAGEGEGPVLRIAVPDGAEGALERAARAEALLATEFGYAPVALDGAALAALAGGGLGLRHLLTAGGGTLFELLAFAADFHAREALLEVRLLAADGTALARTVPLRLEFAPELRAVLQRR